MCIVIALMSTAAIGEVVAVVPKAVLINSSNHLLVTKDKVWSAKETAEGVASLRQRISINRYQLSTIDDRKVRNCFRGVECGSELELSAVEHSRTQPTSSNSGMGPVVSPLSDDIMVAYWPGNPNQIIPIDKLTGRMVDLIDGGAVVSIDVQKRFIVVAMCEPGSYKCVIRLQPFGSMSSHLLTKVEFRIVDMTVVDKVIFAIAKKPSSRKSLGSGMFAAAGHGQFFENWLVLEISLESAKVQSFPIAENLKNASAFFPTKWDRR